MTSVRESAQLKRMLVDFSPCEYRALGQCAEVSVAVIGAARVRAAVSRPGRNGSAKVAIPERRVRRCGVYDRGWKLT
jgi:hypothetical protein